MRILAMQNKIKNEYAAFEIDSIWYDDEHQGLAFHTLEDVCCYISNISLEDYNRICKTVVERGYFDLTSYDEFEIDEEEI